MEKRKITGLVLTKAPKDGTHIVPIEKLDISPVFTPTHTRMSIEFGEVAAEILRLEYALAGKTTAEKAAVIDNASVLGDVTEVDRFGHFGGRRFCRRVFAIRFEVYEPLSKRKL